MTDDLTLMPKKKVDAETTKLTLNGTDVSGTSASIYAPLESGTADYILQSNGEGNAPTWGNSIKTNGITSTSYIGMKRNDATDRLAFFGGTKWGDGAFLELDSKGYSDSGRFILCARADNGSTKVSKDLIGRPDGTLTWNGKNILLEGDVPVYKEYTKATTAITIANHQTYYFKVGRLVVVCINFKTTTTGTVSRGTTIFSGLPATARDIYTTVNYGASAIGQMYVSSGGNLINEIDIAADTWVRGELTYLESA